MAEHRTERSGARLAPGRYTWKGNNACGDNHRCLLIGPGSTFALEIIDSAGPQGSSGHTIRGRIQPMRKGRFTLVGKTNESWVRDNDPWNDTSRSRKSFQVVERTSWCRREVDVDGEIYVMDAMKQIFNAFDRAEIAGRIGKLTPKTRRRWGTMNVAQMLTHVHRVLKTATGELERKRPFKAWKNLTGERPWARSLPTDPTFIVNDARDFRTERAALVATISRLTNAASVIGPLTSEERGILMYRHIDHHLRQFGA